MQLFDVIEVSIDTNDVRVLSRGYDDANAKAIVEMAVWRRGVETCFYAAVPTGKYRDGDKYVVEEIDELDS